MNQDELRQFVIDVIDEEFGPRPIPIAKRWEGGKLVMQPGGDTQAKEIPLEVFFKKIIGLRESMRVLEQKINGQAALTQEDKVTLQSYITKCYGSMTSFNILFKEDKDRFVGSTASTREDDTPKLTLGQARKKLGLNEYGND